MADMEALVCGGDHEDKVGKMVRLETDINGRREIWWGKLIGLKDQFGPGDDLVKTLLDFGEDTVVLDWDKAQVEAKIRVVQ